MQTFSVTGGDLLQRLVSEDSLMESEAAFYLRQLLLAVEYMHAQNVIHLDLKVVCFLCCNRNLQTSKVPLKSQAQGTSLFISTVCQSLNFIRSYSIEVVSIQPIEIDSVKERLYVNFLWQFLCCSVIHSVISSDCCFEHAE